MGESDGHGLGPWQKACRLLRAPSIAIVVTGATEEAAGVHTLDAEAGVQMLGEDLGEAQSVISTARGGKGGKGSPKGKARGGKGAKKKGRTPKATKKKVMAKKKKAAKKAVHKATKTLKKTHLKKAKKKMKLVNKMAKAKRKPGSRRLLPISPKR